MISTHQVQFWVTEFGWDTKPPRSGAASVSLASRWTSESLYQMWRNGVSLVTWFLIQDFRSPSKYQSGLYFYAPTLAAAKPKPVLTAFRFPFVAYLGKKVVTIWGRDGTSDQQLVNVQLRHGTKGPWKTVGLVRANTRRHLQGEPEAEGDEDGLAPRRRSQVRRLARLLAHPAAGSARRPLGHLSSGGPGRGCKKSAKVGTVISDRR